MSQTNNLQNFNLRIIPWFTDGCSTFLANLLKWLPKLLGKRLSVLEFGGGNSTFFFLSKGVRVISVESDHDYVQFLTNVALNTGFSVSAFNTLDEYAASGSQYDLSIIIAKKLADIPNIISQVDADIIVNDGISRREVLEDIIKICPNSIVILDNVEYSANWGRLDRTSGKPDLIKVYRSFLRSTNWRTYIFEQSEGRQGRGVADKAGWESPHRWMSAISWPKDHRLQDLIITNLGFPVVNAQGVNDSDLESLGDRSPFDWDTMKWLCEPFPAELDLGLDRDYN